MSSNATQLPPLLESVTQIQTRNFTIHPGAKSGASDGVLLGGAGSSPRGSVCMDFSRFLTIQLGAQKEANRWRNRAMQACVSEMLPAEADDRSRTGGRCDYRRPCVNSRARSAAEQHIGEPGEGVERCSITPHSQTTALREPTDSGR